MRDMVTRFLSAEQRIEIERRVRAAEARSSGEIVVMVVPSSSRYPAAAIASAVAFGIPLAVLASVVWGRQGMWEFLLLFSMIFIVIGEVSKRTFFLKRLFVTRRERFEEVEEAAVRAFHERKIHQTGGRNGILIFISLFERSVRILADSGIHARVRHGAWQEIADMITEGIHNGRQSEAVCGAVDRCSALLEEHFPAKPGDRNELSDAMIVGR